MLNQNGRIGLKFEQADDSPLLWSLEVVVGQTAKRVKESVDAMRRQPPCPADAVVDRLAFHRPCHRPHRHNRKATNHVGVAEVPTAPTPSPRPTWRRQGGSLRHHPTVPSPRPAGLLRRRPSALPVSSLFLSLVASGHEITGTDRVP